jgi:hypothetical protein
VAIRTGAQYLTGLRERPREVWLGSRRVADAGAHRTAILHWDPRRTVGDYGGNAAPLDVPTQLAEFARGARAWRWA